MTPGIYQPTWVTDQLAVGAAPMSHSQLDSLHSAGITAILNLCGEFTDLHEIERAAGFEVYYLPLPDEEAPELVELEKALAWLDEAIYLGKKVLIHCRHGIGRTGTLLNAYLLRRGLGHRQAWRKLKSLRAKPANFAQWWTIRKYGKKSPRLTVREPTLEMRREFDLQPFFHDYEALCARVDGLAPTESAGCGSDHAHCCRTPVLLSLIEAVSLTHHMNARLTSVDRLAVIAHATALAARERPASEDDLGAPENEASLCPLNRDGSCLLFTSRPLPCRCHGLNENVVREIRQTVLTPALERLSLELWLGFAGAMAKESITDFSLVNVVSGKYVQTLFQLLTRSR